MSCLLDNDTRDALRVKIAGDFIDFINSGTPFDIKNYIKEIYDLFKEASQDEALSVDAARLVPTLALQLISVDAELKAGMRKLDKTIGSKLDEIELRYEDLAELNKDLGLDIDPAEAAAAANEIAQVIKPEPLKPEPPVEEVIEKPFEFISSEGLYTFGPEFKNYTKPEQLDYLKPKLSEVRNFNALNYIDSVLLKQISEGTAENSGTMDLPGVGKVFLKIVHAADLSPEFQKNFEVSPSDKIYFDRGKLMAVVVDENNNPVLFSQDGKPDSKGKPVVYRPYTRPATTEAGNIAVSEEQLKEYLKRNNITEYKDTVPFREVFNNVIKPRFAELKKQIASTNPKLTEKEVEKKAKEALNEQFSQLINMTDYLVKNPGSSIRGAINGGAQGFVLYNEYRPSQVSEAFDEFNFKPYPIVKTQEAGSNVSEGRSYVNYPGIERPIPIVGPDLVDSTKILETVLNLYTEPLFTVDNKGNKVEVTTAERKRLIEQYMLNKHSKVSFLAKKEGDATIYENADGSYSININGKVIHIKYDNSESSVAERKKIREEIEKAFKTPSKGQELKEGFKDQADVKRTLNRNPGANIITDLADAKKGSILKEGDKYFRVDWPAVIPIGSKIDKLYDDPSFEKDDKGDTILKTQPKAYNQFMLENFVTPVVTLNGKIRKVNPVISYGIDLADYNKITGKPLEEKAVEEKPSPAEVKKEENSQVTQKSIADMSIKDMYGAMDKLEKKTGQKVLNKVLSEEELKKQEEEAKTWYAKSPLSKVIPYEVMNAVINTQSVNSPVAQWSVHGIVLFHYYSENGKFIPSKSADYTDLYHEAWHGFTQTFLTQEQRDNLYAEVRKRSGSFTDYNGKLVSFKDAEGLQLEEFLAEEFREYMMSGGKKIIKGAPVRNTFFRKILNMLKALFSGSSVNDVVQDPLSHNMVKELYDNLRKGDLSAYNFDINNRDKTIGKLNKTVVAREDKPDQPKMLGYEDSMKLVSTMDALISKIADDMNKLNNTHGYSSKLMSTVNNRKLVYNIIKKKLKEEIIPNLEKKKEAETESYLKDQIQQRINLVQYALDQFGDTENLSNNKDGKGLIAFHIEKSKFLSAEDKLSALEEENEDENQEEENLANKDNKFGSSGNEISAYDRADAEVKQLLKSIFKYNENKELVYNDLGVEELSESSVIWNKIVRAKGEAMSMTDIYNKLDKAAFKRNSKGEVTVLDPALAMLLNKLGPLKANGTMAETQLWIGFWKTFNLSYVPLVQVTMKESKDDQGNISHSLSIGASNTASRQASNLWRNSFLSVNTDYIKTDEQNKNYLDVNKVLADFTDKATGKLKKGESFEFLRAIGVRLSDKEDIRAAINKGVGDPSRLFNKLKTLADPNGRNLTQLRTFDALFSKYPATKGLEELSGNSQDLIALTDLETRYSDYASNYSVTNANGNQQFEQSQHNTISILVNTINLAEDVKDSEGNVVKSAYNGLMDLPSMQHLNIDKNPQAASSVWLNSVFMLYDEQGKRYPEVDNQGNKVFGKRRIMEGKPVEIKLSNLSGLQMISEKFTVGTDSAGADDFAKLIMDFHLQNVINRPELMRHADKGTSYSTWLTNIFGTYGTSGRYANIEDFYTRGTAENPNIRAYTDLSKVIKKYIDAEVKRMSKMRQMKEDIKKGKKVTYDANYINEGQKMLIFESILSDEAKALMENTSSLDEALKNNPSLDNIINNDLEKYFEGQVNDLQKYVKKNKSEFISKQLITETQRKASNTDIKNYDVENTKKALYRAFVLNNWIHNVESMNVIYGDIAQYNMYKEEFHKRNAGAGSTGNVFSTDRHIIDYVNNKGRLYAKSKNIPEKTIAYDGSYDSAVMADNVVNSAYLPEIQEGIEDSIRERYKNKLDAAKNKPEELKKLEKEIADKVKQAIKPYTEMKEGDAQGWITFDFYRAVSMLEGKWTSQQEKLYKDICNNVPVKPEDVAQFFPVKKYQYWGALQTGEDQLPLQAFHKFALLPLIPTLIQGTNLENLHNKMMAEGVDYSLFKSGSKISTVTNLSYNEKTDLIEAEEDKFYSKGRDFDEKNTFVKNTVFLQYLKDQLEIAPKFKRKVSFPTQMRKLIENSLYERGGALKPEFQTLVEDYEKDLALLTSLKKAKLEKEAGIERDASGKIIFNEKLRKFLINELERQELADHEIDFIRKGPGKDKLAHDLSISLSSQKLEKILSSLVVKRLVKQKFNGEGLIQVSGAGFESTLRGLLTEEEKLKYNAGTNELPFYKREVIGEDKNGKPIYGKTKAMKVKIALQGDFVKLLGLTHRDGQPIGDLKRLNEMLKDEEWLNEGDHRKMISITGPRIPTQENNSMEFAEVYEFLPKEAGNIVVLPSEIVAKSGGDFDVDKITFMMPNIMSNPNIEAIDFAALGQRFPEFGEEGVRTIFENRKDETRTEEEQEILDAIYDSAPQNVTLPLDQKTEAGLENRVLNHMRNILELKELYSNLVRPNDTDLVKPIADKLESLVSEYNPRTTEYTDKKGKTNYRIPGSRVFEIRYNLYKHGTNNVGKQALGLGAVDNTYNTIFNRIGARFNHMYTTKAGVGRILNLLLPHNTQLDEKGRSTISLSDLYDIEGTSISSVIAQLMNGWVDVAKDAWIFNMQGNKEVTPVLLLLTQAGVPIRQSAYYVSQPLIRKYINEQNLAKSAAARAINKGGDNPNFYRNEARRTILKELYGEAQAKKLLSNKNLEEFINSELLKLTNPESGTVKDFFAPDKIETNLLSKLEENKKKQDAGEEITYSDEDKAMFLHYLEMEEMAKGLRDVKMSTNVDTSRTNSIYEAETKKAKYQDAEASKMFPAGMVRKIKENSPISSYFIQDFQIDFLKELFPLKANQVVNDFLYNKLRDKQDFEAANEKTFNDAETLINTFRNDLPAFIFQNEISRIKVLDRKYYRGVSLNNKYTIKTIPSLSFGVFVKPEEGKPVIYTDKEQISKNFKNLGNLNQKVKLNDGTVITLPELNKSLFETEQSYAAFLMERELARYKYTRPGKFELFEGRLDYQTALKKLKNNELRLTDETDAHFEARIKTLAFEETLKNIALDNTFNMNKLFIGKETIADQLIKIQVNYPELMNEYSVLRNLSVNFSEDKNERVGNVMLNNTMLDADKLNVYHQNLLELSNPASIKIRKDIPSEEKLRITQFFNNFAIYAFLQSGMNTAGRYSLTRLVPQDRFTRLMTTYLEGENIDGVQTPGFLQNINDLTLQKYWKKFVNVNAYDNSNRNKFKNYKLSPNEGGYTPSADKNLLNSIINSDEFNKKPGDRDMNRMLLVKSLAPTVVQEEGVEAPKKQVSKQAVKPVTFSQDANGNMLYDAKQAAMSSARTALAEKPDSLFVINGTAGIAGKAPNVSQATSGEAALLSVSNGASTINFPVRKNFSTVGFQLTDTTPSGKEVEPVKQPTTQPTVQPVGEVKEGVSELFESNPELAKVGSEKQYTQYLNTVFPESKVKDIFYHGAYEDFIKKGKKFEGIGGYHFGTKKAAQERLKARKQAGEKEMEMGWFDEFALPPFQQDIIYPVILNINKLDTASDQGDSESWEKLIEKRKVAYDAIKYSNLVEDKGSISYVVFKPEQIHVLGSNEDIQGFKKFVSKPITQPTVQGILPGPETKINIYAGTGENAELSNFAERPFMSTILKGLGAVQFKNVEQAFQYAKGEYYNEYAIDPSSTATPETQRAKVEKHLKDILAAKTGAEAKALGRKNIRVDFENESWDQASSGIMKKLLLESFKQNPDALAKLLATGNATLTHTQDKGKWGTEFPRLLMEVRNELRAGQPVINTASSIDNTVTTSMKDDSKTIQPIPGNIIDPEIAKQVDNMIESMKSDKASGKTLYFPKAGFGQYMIGADELTGELPSGKIVPVAPATFVYLSQKLWDNFKYANPNFDVALGYMGMTNVLQEGAEVTDLDVMDALSICFK